VPERAFAQYAAASTTSMRATTRSAGGRSSGRLGKEDPAAEGLVGRQPSSFFRDGCTRGGSPGIFGKFGG
jgi:hypothetical protein